MKPRRLLNGDELLPAFAAGAAVQAQREDLLMLVCPDGRRLRVKAAAVADLAARGLLEQPAPGQYALTPEGRARVARLSAPAAPFLAQHRTLVEADVEGAREPVWCDADESPLAWLARRKDKAGKPLLAPHQFAAGERLRADFTRAQMTPRVTANWEAAIARDRRGAGRAVPLAEAVLAAKANVSRALAAAGPEVAGLLLDVCCFVKGLETVERERGWPPRAAKVVLGLALDRLARHYGIEHEARGPAQGRIRAWSAVGEGG